MDSVFSDNLLLVGKVIRPHGLEGLLRIRSYAQSEKSFLDAGNIFLKTRSGETHECEVLSIRPHKNILLLKLIGLNSLEDAERYRDAEILIRRDLLKINNDNEFFWFELVDLGVYLDTGKFIGKIRHILPSRSNDIYVVRDGEREILIPAIHDIVKKIDLINKKVIIKEMEGLLDLNEV